MRVGFKFFLFVALLIGGGIYLWQRNMARKEEAQLEYQQSLEKEVRTKNQVIRTKAEEMRTVSEEARALRARAEDQDSEWQAARGNKEKTLNLLRAYAAREEQRLNKKIAEENQWLAEIENDIGLLSEALSAVEKTAREKEENSRRRKQKYYANAERVMLIFQNEDINTLAERYLGEDFSASRAAYYERVNSEIRIHTDQVKKLKANRDEYRKTIEGVSEGVERKNQAAERQIRTTYESAQRNLSSLEARRRKLERDRDQIRGGFQGSDVKARLERLARSLDSVDREIRAARLQCASVESQLAHLSATASESAARKRVDTAQEVRQTADNDVQAETQHERAVFLLAEGFERDSLGKLRAAIQGRRDILLKSKSDALEKLDFMRAAIVNADLMNVGELDQLRGEFVRKLAEGVNVKLSDKADKRANKRP